MELNLCESINKKKTYSTDENIAFIHGYTYAQAERIKQEGHFKDFTISELIQLLLTETLKSK